MFPSNGQVYSQLCGRVVGYQKGSPDGVDDTLTPGSDNFNIDSYYVDGVSLKYMDHLLIKHIWTFMGSIQEIPLDLNQFYLSML